MLYPNSPKTQSYSQFNVGVGTGNNQISPVNDGKRGERDDTCCHFPSIHVEGGHGTPRIFAENGCAAGEASNHISMRPLSAEAIALDDKEHTANEEKECRWQRGLMGNFVNAQVQADYDRDHPMINLSTGLKSMLGFSGLTFIFRLSYNTTSFVDQLDGRNKNEYVYSMVVGGILVVLVTALTALVNRAVLDRDALRLASYGKSLLLVSFFAWWSYTQMELDTPHYTNIVMQTDTYVNWTQCQGIPSLSLSLSLLLHAPPALSCLAACLPAPFEPFFV